MRRESAGQLEDVGQRVGESRWDGMRKRRRECRWWVVTTSQAFVSAQKEKSNIINDTYRTHMMNTVYFITGSLTPPNTSANLSSARPLLVVHSGKTTTGALDVLRISSSVSGLADVAPETSGRCAVDASMRRRPTRRKPRIGVRCVGVRAVGDEIAADPVPVRRPGVRESGVNFSGGGGMSRVSTTGRMNMGLKLAGTELMEWV